MKTRRIILFGVIFILFFLSYSIHGVEEIEFPVLDGRCGTWFWDSQHNQSTGQWVTDYAISGLL